MPKQKKQILVLKKEIRVFGAKPASSILKVYCAKLCFFPLVIACLYTIEPDI
jgi:hypothetical protein